MRSPCTSSTRLAAKPPRSASLTLAGSTPALRATAKASLTPARAPPMAIWLQILQVCPAPGSGPTCTMRSGCPMHSRIGRTRARASLSPPTMMESVALMAPTSPPLTGASIMVPPLAATSAARRRVATGEMLLMSITTVPVAIVSRMPAGPAITASTSGVSGTIVMMMLACDATSAGELAAMAPAATSSVTAGVLRLNTTTEWPLASRCLAMGRPITPRPMKPTFSDMVPRSIGGQSICRRAEHSGGGHYQRRDAISQLAGRPSHMGRPGSVKGCFL